MRSPGPWGLLLLAACSDGVSPGLASLEIFPDSAIHFPAIGDTVQLVLNAADQDGRPVVPSDVGFVSRNSAVARVDGAGRVESIGDGSTFVVVQAGQLEDSLRVSVAQAKDSLVLSLLTPDQIVSLPVNGTFPLRCRVFDSNGDLVALSNTLTSATGTISGSSCETATAQRSGHDTLVVTAGSYQSVLPVVVAIRPELISDPSTPLDIDSLPAGSSPWAPTLVRNSSGDLDLYFAAYHEATDQLGGKRGDLHRLTSTDGIHFQYAGVALARDPFPCSPRGTGIENVAIVPRSDAAGWRMYFAAGSDDCFGWQVFSATSDDELTWTREAGIRIANGGSATSLHRTLPPFPAGEGMELELLESGEWQMLVGAYERREPRENRFQITQWRSTDQVHWSYRGAVLTTRQVGPEARRSIYSPTTMTLAPGLKRLYFTGDNLDVAGGASRIYSAVSVDGTGWQIEGVILDGGGADYFYSTMESDLLVFIRSVSGSHTLGSTRILSR